jgi:hypothetical protein
VGVLVGVVDGRVDCATTERAGKGLSSHTRLTTIEATLRHGARMDQARARYAQAATQLAQPWLN